MEDIIIRNNLIAAEAVFELNPTPNFDKWIDSLVNTFTISLPPEQTDKKIQTLETLNYQGFAVS